MPVGDRVLALRGQVGNVANATEDRTSARSTGDVNGQPDVMLDLDRRLVRLRGDYLVDQGPRHVQPLLRGEEGSLLRVLADRQDDAVEHPPGTLQHVQMAERYRVERPCV